MGTAQNNGDAVLQVRRKQKHEHYSCMETPCQQHTTRTTTHDLHTNPNPFPQLKEPPDSLSAATTRNPNPKTPWQEKKL